MIFGPPVKPFFGLPYGPRRDSGPPPPPRPKPSWMNIFKVVQIIIMVGNSGVAKAESRNAHQLCSIDGCARTELRPQIGASMTSPSALTLLPGTYTSSSSLAESDLLPDVSFTSNPRESTFGDLTAFNGSSIVNLNNSTAAAAVWPLKVNYPTMPIWFERDTYQSQPNPLDLSDLTTNSTIPSTTALDSWSSLYLPQGVYVYFPSNSFASISGSEGAAGGGITNAIFRASVVKRELLPREVGGGKGWGDWRKGMDLDLRGAVFGSDNCNPPCGAHALCLPSTSSNTSALSSLPSPSFTCHCPPNFSGPTCSDCAPGFYGPDCKACSEQCGRKCDDGVEGSGGCLGVMGDSQASCNCLHGTCTSSNTCACSAGWIDSRNATGSRCSECGDGFYQDAGGDCTACPLGSLTGTSASASTACVSGYSINAATGLCTPSGGQASCSDGQYWDGGRCNSCSPSCQTCIGPSPGDCLRCQDPRHNLNGTCVGYDTRTGICDSAGSDLSGVYFANTATGRCDACPRGCLSCGTPNFTVDISRNSTTCTACQEGWVLQAGQCVEECRGGYFLPEGPASINGTCQACDTGKCSTCTRSATSCTTCASPADFATESGDCVAACPAGTNADTASRRCVACPSECATCSGDGQCLTCKPANPLLRNGRCSSTCPISTYWEPGSASCQSCSGNCTSCLGPAPNQCLSCEEGNLMKLGTCSPGNCAVVAGLGICIDSDISKEALWWPYLLIVVGLLGILGAIFWWIRRSRRLRREATAAFASTMDDNEVNKRMQGFNVFEMLKNMRASEKSPAARESFFSVDPDQNGPPPAYEPRKMKAAFTEPSFSITLPSPTAAGPARAPNMRDADDKEYMDGYEGKRPSRRVSFADVLLEEKRRIGHGSKRHPDEDEEVLIDRLDYKGAHAIV